jgi:hypothetical protein
VQQVNVKQIKPLSNSPIKKLVKSEVVLSNQDEIDENIMCYIVGLPSDYTQYDVVTYIKKMSQEDVKVDLPVTMEWKKYSLLTNFII